MSNVDFGQNKFEQDSHGNLIPKDVTCNESDAGIPADSACGQDVEIMNEYGLED